MAPLPLYCLLGGVFVLYNGCNKLQDYDTTYRVYTNYFQARFAICNNQVWVLFRI